MEDFITRMKEEKRQMPKMEAYIKSHAEIYNYFKELVDTGSRYSKTIRNFEDALADVQKTEKEMDSCLQKIQELQKELAASGIELVDLKTFAPSGYVPILQTKAKGTYAKHDYIKNIETIEFFGEKTKNSSRLKFPVLMKTAKGSLTLDKMAAEDKDFVISKQAQKWLDEHKKLMKELTKQEKEIQKAEKLLAIYEQMPLSVIDKKLETLKKEISAKKNLLNQEKKKIAGVFLIASMLNFYRSITPPQRTLIKKYASELEHFESLSKEMEKQIERAIEAEAEVFGPMDSDETFVQISLVKGSITQEKINEIEEVLITTDFSSIEPSTIEESEISPRSKMIEQLLFTYCYNRIIPKRAVKPKQY